MEPIKLQGTKIVDAKYMKQSRLMRYTLELTENDTKLYAAVMAIMQTQELLADILITPTEIEGNDNGFEVPRPRSKTQAFRSEYILRNGAPAYERIKKEAGVEHLTEIDDFQGFCEKHMPGWYGQFR